MTNTTDAVKPDLGMALAFVKAITDQDDPVIRIRVLDDKGKEKLARGAKPHKPAEKSGRLTDLWPALEKLQDEGFGVFWLPNLFGFEGDRCARDADATSFPALFCDYDNGPPSEWHRAPDIIVHTREGHSHAYWCIAEDATGEEWEHGQRRLIAFYPGADNVIHNPSRLMRLPGTLHMKGEPRLVTFTSSMDPDAHLMLPTMAEVLEGVPDVAAAAKPKTAPEGVELDTELAVRLAVEYLKERATSSRGIAKENNGGNNKTYFTACRLKDKGISEDKAYDLMLEHWNAYCSPPWEPEELRATVHNAFAYGQNETGSEAPKPAAEIFKLPPDWMDHYEDGEDDPLASGYDPGDRPVVQIVESELPRVIDQAEDVLIAADVPIYQCGNMLVRPGLTAFKIADGQEATNVRLIPISKPAMVEAFTKAVEFQRFDKRSNSWVRKDCPPTIAEVYLAREDWRLRKLTGIVHTPTLRPDGSLLDQPGYDAATGLLYEPCGVTFPAIAQEPSKDDAAAALAMFKDLLRTFPFTSPASLSVSLSGLLTTLIRRSLTTAPLHGMNAPTAGSGKSLQVDMAALLGTGKAAPVIAQGGDEAETSKRLGAELMAGSSIISLDNCTEPVEGTLLCQMLTQQYVRPRILGQSKNLEVLSNAMVFATGNNLTFAGDMTRRAIMSTIDPGVERPELRSFDYDPRDLIRRDRPRYVAAGLTVLRAYVAAGRPAMAQPLGSFEDWSGLIRNALVWLGEADPCDTMEDLRESDPEREKLGRLLYHWEQVIGTKKVSVKQIVEAIHGDRTEARSGLYDALISIGAPSNGKGLSTINGRMIGDYLAKHQKRVVDGRQVVKQGLSGGNMTWQLYRQAA